MLYTPARYVHTYSATYLPTPVFMSTEIQDRIYALQPLKHVGRQTYLHRQPGPLTHASRAYITGTYILLNHCGSIHPSSQPSLQDVWGLASLTFLLHSFFSCSSLHLCMTSTKQVSKQPAKDRKDLSASQPIRCPKLGT